MILVFIAAWAGLIAAFLNMPWEITPILVLPTLPLTAFTFMHIGGYAFAQEDREQLDSVLDMFSFPHKWSPIENGESIPHVVMVWENRTGEVFVAFNVGDKPVKWAVNRAYAAKFRRKLALLKDWREMQALVDHFKELEK